MIPFKILNKKSEYNSWFDYRRLSPAHGMPKILKINFADNYSYLKYFYFKKDWSNFLIDQNILNKFVNYKLRRSKILKIGQVTEINDGLS